MASYGVRITLPLPTAGSVQWDGPLGDVINAIVDVVAARVGVDGLDVNGTLDVQGHEVINALDLRLVTNGDQGVANSVFINSSGELCVRDGSNRLVQVTSGGTVNVAGTSGFGGDYASLNPGGATFTNATSTFTFTVSGGTVYATMEHGAVKIHNGSSAQAVTVQSPTIASSYNFTLPTSLPTNGGPTVLRWDATGSLQAAASASFTQSVDVSSAQPCSNLQLSPVIAGETSLQNGISLSPTTSSVRIGFEFPINYQFGDRIDAVQFTTAGLGTTTGTLYFRDDTGGTNVIARKAFNLGGAGPRVLQAGAATMTGTLPYNTTGTGSLTLRVEFGPQSGVTEALWTVRFSGMRKLIS